MTVSNFLKLHQDGCIQCISIHVLPYDYSKHRYSKTYFEEVSQDEIEQSEIFKSIKNRKVNHFNVIGGGIDPVELCIYLQEEGNE